RWLDEIDNPAGTRAVLGALADAVRAWRVNDRRDSLLWNASHIELAERLLRDRRQLLNAHEAEFVRRSAQLFRNRRRRLSDTLVARQRLLASSYQEDGRRLLLEGRPLEAVPYLVEARKVSALGVPLRMLFSAARRSVLASIEHRGPVLTAQFSPDG